MLYCLLAVKVRFQDIAETLVNRRSGAIRVRHISPSMILQQLLAKSLWVVWRIVVPNVLFRIPLLQVLLLTAVIEFSTGLWLAYNFQVSHISPLAEYFFIIHISMTFIYCGPSCDRESYAQIL